VLLELNHIEKRYGGVTALGDGNLCVQPGEVHLLLGENGAGKSTLMKIIAGIVERDAGQMLWQGREIHLKTPAEAAAIGISMVHHESLPAPHLTVAENLYLGREERLPLGWVRRRRMIEAASRVIAEHQFAARGWRVEKLTRRKAAGGDLPRHPAWLEPGDLR
jgi:ABC-type sugar transport system ATPase subunit